MSRFRRKLSLLEPLEPRTLLTATPLVMGYLVDYKIGNSSNAVFSENASGAVVHDTLNWNVLKEVNYFALLPNASPAYNGSNPESSATSNGALQATTDSGYNPAAQLPAVVAEANKHGAKVYVTVGGGDPAAIYDMDALVNTPSAWGTFAANIKNFCTKYGLAGVDLDWEPTGQSGFTVTAAQIDNFGKLVKAIKTADPSLKLTADALGDPVELSTSAGADTGKSAFMLNATAVASLDAINVEAYPVGSASVANTIMANWASYVAGGKKDLDGVSVVGHVSQLQYGLDIDSDDTSNKPAGVIEAKVDTTIHNGYGGIFVFELDSDTASPSVITRIGNEITKDNTPTGGNVSGFAKTSAGVGISGVTIYLDANNNSTKDSGELFTTTNSSGAYSFTNVPAAAYHIRQILPGGDTQTSPSGNAGISITVVKGGNLVNENFTDTVPSSSNKGSITGTVKTASGAAVAGVTIYLNSSNSATLNGAKLSAVTNASGVFTFSNLPAGTFNLWQQIPTGDTQTTPAKNAGYVVTLAAGATATGKNFVDTVAAGPKLLTGTIIGSTNALTKAATGHPAANAFDGKTTTVFEDSQANTNWLGLDLGSAKVITQIKFAADPAHPSFMEGGIFQASSSSTFASNVVNLYQVPNTSTPSTSLTTIAIKNTSAFRYVRYLAPANSFGDIAEIQFYG